MATPRLLIETWRQIFRDAAYVPRLLDPPPAWDSWVLECSCKADPYTCNADHSHEEETDPAVHTRRSITSTCRLWREIGSEYRREVIEVPRLNPSEVEAANWH